MTLSPAQDHRFRLDSEQAKALAAAYGTPLYVLSERHLRAKAQAYLAAATACYPNTEIAFASKANSTLAVLAIFAREGLFIDVASEGELQAALAAGVPADRCHLHGNNKSAEEIEFAVQAGISKIVVDHFGEIEMLAELARTRKLPDLVLRLAPGVDPITHAKISTGQADTKFGFNIADGSAERALARALALELPVVGFHCHVGSQLLDPEAQRGGGEFLARFAVEMLERHGFRTAYINVGGGLGVQYVDGEEPMPLTDYCRLVAEAVLQPLAGSGLQPVLAQEPGRALVAESGVTLYRVGVVKTVPAAAGPKTYLAVDGGLSDNPRPALYGSRYTVERVGRGVGDWSYTADGPGALSFAAPMRPFTISGKHCETDLLFPNVELPGDMAEGDLLQVLSTGAYNASMASNYNRFPRPATALIRENGSHTLVQRRDTWEEMLARETVPEDLR